MIPHRFSKTSKIPSKTIGDADCGCGGGGVSAMNDPPLVKGVTGALMGCGGTDVDGVARGSSMPSPISSKPDALRSASSAMSSLEDGRRSRGKVGDVEKDMPPPPLAVELVDRSRGEGEWPRDMAEDGEGRYMGEGASDEWREGSEEDRNSLSSRRSRSVTVTPGGRSKSGRGMRL
jgi:hypothetical protein